MMRSRRELEQASEAVGIAVERQRCKRELDRQALERSEFDVAGSQVFATGLSFEEAKRPLNAIGARVLSRINRFKQSGPLAKFGAEVFASERLDSDRESLSPQDLRLYLAETAIALAETFDDLDHMLFDGKKGEDERTILGGTEVQEDTQELVEWGRGLAKRAQAETP